MLRSGLKNNFNFIRHVIESLVKENEVIMKITTAELRKKKYTSCWEDNDYDLTIFNLDPTVIHRLKATKKMGNFLFPE